MVAYRLQLPRAFAMMMNLNDGAVHSSTNFMNYIHKSSYPRLCQTCCSNQVRLYSLFRSCSPDRGALSRLRRQYGFRDPFLACNVTPVSAIQLNDPFHASRNPRNIILRLRFLSRDPSDIPWTHKFLVPLECTQPGRRIRQRLFPFSLPFFSLRLRPLLFVRYPSSLLPRQKARLWSNFRILFGTSSLACSSFQVI
ncbi:hypothetical protein PM082_021470 [Marasmius tenuissimus]|nr:hypothetical protein PM082_021470 [Marasmius tenuissimus]